ncbi:hypothetical protein [Nonomuraea soli]|uniref:Mersacidin/lichenicidin family type 2 lantibiotic n=1 Tax=Nonomuraea soli TaxID=1032476 RepID=A0A7W0CNR3_9ACTN|nr:hypothetical protein [Nonomuraea soli]MBA2894320.1 hypothetical protein [Nonomuraea soli]
MSDNELVHQWKTPHLRDISAAHPSGEVVLDDLVGGRPARTEYYLSIGCCPTYTKSQNCGVTI